jgi:predicted transglutaminase-like cysteine proteinase
MANFSTARTVTGAIIGLAVLTAGAFPGEAASKAKPRKYIFDDLVTPSMLVPPSPPVRVSTDGARFFSINSVLAKLDGKPKVNEPVRLASITSSDVLSDAPAELINTTRMQITNEPFGLFTFRAPEGVLWRKWRAVKADIDADLRQVESCKSNSSACSDAARRFMLIVNEVRARTGVARIETANRLINGAIRYMSDLAQHATVDVWSAPLASLGTGRGDCEDYAIAKYVVLREAGVSEQDLRVLLVRDRNVREDHAVLAIRNGEAWTVLDNRSSALTPDRELRHFKPLFALDSGGVNLVASPYLSRRQTIEDTTVSPASEAVGSDDATAVWGATIDGAATSIAGTGAGAATLPILI